MQNQNNCCNLNSENRIVSETKENRGENNSLGFSQRRNQSGNLEKFHQPVRANQEGHDEHQNVKYCENVNSKIVNNTKENHSGVDQEFAEESCDNVEHPNQEAALMNYLTKPDVDISAEKFPMNFSVYTVLLPNGSEATSSDKNIGKSKRRKSSNSKSSTEMKRSGVNQDTDSHPHTLSNRASGSSTPNTHSYEDSPSLAKRNRAETSIASTSTMQCPVVLQKTVDGKGCKSQKVRTWRKRMLELNHIKDKPPTAEEIPPTATKADDSDSTDNEEYTAELNRQLLKKYSETTKKLKDLPRVYLHAFNSLNPPEVQKTLQNVYLLKITANVLQLVNMDFVFPTFKNLIKRMGFTKLLDDPATLLTMEKTCVNSEIREKYFRDYKRQFNTFISRIICKNEVTNRYDFGGKSLGFMGYNLTEGVASSESPIECDYVEAALNLNSLEPTNHSNQLSEDPIDDIPAKETRRQKQLFLLARNPDGNFIGIKVGDSQGDTDAPSTSEMIRLRNLSNSISSALQYKTEIERGEVEADPNRVVTNLQLSVEERILAIEASVVERKQQRLKWLQIESKLVEHDSEIKSYLGLERADTEKALECLNQILELNVEQLMLTKHPHVIDMVRRLRRYIGNVKSWNWSREQIDGFAKGAELIRNKADEVYQKFKGMYVIEPGKTFSDVYNEHVTAFKEQTKHMTEPQRFAVCAKPGTKLFESDEVDDKLEIEAIKLKNEIERKKNARGSGVSFEV